MGRFTLLLIVILLVVSPFVLALNQPSLVRAPRLPQSSCEIKLLSLQKYGVTCTPACPVDTQTKWLWEANPSGAFEIKGIMDNTLTQPTTATAVKLSAIKQSGALTATEQGPKGFSCIIAITGPPPTASPTVRITAPSAGTITTTSTTGARFNIQFATTNAAGKKIKVFIDENVQPTLLEASATSYTTPVLFSSGIGKLEIVEANGNSLSPPVFATVSFRVILPQQCSQEQTQKCDGQQPKVCQDGRWMEKKCNNGKQLTCSGGKVLEISCATNTICIESTGECEIKMSR